MTELYENWRKNTKEYNHCGHEEFFALISGAAEINIVQHCNMAGAYQRGFIQTVDDELHVLIYVPDGLDEFKKRFIADNKNKTMTHKESGVRFEHDTSQEYMHILKRLEKQDHISIAPMEIKDASSSGN